MFADLAETLDHQYEKDKHELKNKTEDHIVATKALNPDNKNGTEELRKKQKEMKEKAEEEKNKLESYAYMQAWKNALHKTGTPTYRLLKSTLEDSVDGVIGEIIWYRKYWEFFLSGNISLIMPLALALVIVVVAVPFLLDEFQAFVAFIGPVIAAVYGAFTQILDGSKCVREVAEVIEKATQEEVDVGIGEDPLDTLQLLNLKNEITVLKDKLGDTVETQLGTLPEDPDLHKLPNEYPGDPRAVQDAAIRELHRMMRRNKKRRMKDPLSGQATMRRSKKRRI